MVDLSAIDNERLQSEPLLPSLLSTRIFTCNQNSLYFFFLASPPLPPYCVFALQMFIDMALRRSLPLSLWPTVPLCLLSQRGANKATNEPLTLAPAD